MPTAETPLWTAVYPEGWVTEAEDDSVIIYDDDDGIGTLEISCFCKDDGPVERQELLDLAADTIEAGARRMEVELGGKQGLMFSFTDEEGTAWKEWYLAADNCIFFITYDCPEDMEGIEDDELVGIIESLRLAA